ncbi:predicted protein [Chaetoceros tenuissimus]|uniref:ShKT domain-containing protein n=1 Tax=Chaetoceros tenuissimus TaxID=426638 RepID=A0AAD3CR49_9STRA|nr:predicted protein [Chaetoceros tenuissimus]
MTFSCRKGLILIVHISLGSTAFSALCSNNSSFQFTHSSKSRDCLWLKNQDDSIREPLCRDSAIRSNCSFSCGLCCNDNPFARFVINGNSRSCSWIAMKDRRKNRFCDEIYGGKFVKDECPVTCNNCPSFISLSEPTSTTSTAPTITTSFPTAAPTKSPIVSPTTNLSGGSGSQVSTNLPANAPSSVNLQHENDETLLTEQTEEKVLPTEQSLIKDDDDRTKKPKAELFLSFGLPLGICGVLLIVALYVKRKSFNQTNNIVKSTQKREESDTKVESGSFGFFKSIDMWTHSEDLDSVNFDESRSMEYEDYLDNNSIVYQDDIIEGGITSNVSMDSLEYSDDE